MLIDTAILILGFAAIDLAAKVVAVLQRERTDRHMANLRQPILPA